MKNIKTFKRNYRDKTPIWWYTNDCFIYSMLNRALRIMDVDVILKMGFFISDLHRQIERLHSNQFGDCNLSKPFIVYRGQGMSTASFKQLRKTKNGLLSFNNFLFTDIHHDRSLHFAQRILRNPDMIGILFVLTVDPSQSTLPFAYISDVSYVEGKNEVLFSSHSIFRINNIKSMDDTQRLFQVELTLLGDNDKDLRALNYCIQEETFSDTDEWHRLGLLLLKMGEYQKARQIYQNMLEKTTDKSERGHIYHLLGWIKYNQRAYKKAIGFYQKALEIYRKTLSPVNSRLADCYKNIASVYNEIGEFLQAASYYEKDLNIKKRSLPSNHLDIAYSFDNIGLVYSNAGNYLKALSFHEKALEIFQSVLPRNHPDLAHSYHNIGLVYYNMGDYSKALASHEKALKIQQQSLPLNYPELAKSYIAHGIIYDQMKDYPKAMMFYEKALEIQQQSLPSDHLDLATCYSNLGLVYSNMGNFQKALSFHEKSLEIQEQSLPSNHPDLAVTCGHIANLYSTMNEYSKARRFCERAVNIAQQSLPSKHPHLRWYRNQLDGIKEKL